MVVAAIHSAIQHIRSSLGFRILPKDTLTYRTGELNQQPSTGYTGYTVYVNVISY